MRIRKSRLSFAIGAVLGATLLAPATTFASGPVGYDVEDEDIEADTDASALLFPIYTTVDGATTSFSVTHQDSKDTSVVKIRFREQEHSMDVLDFLVVLSPEDKFDFWVSQGPNDERPVMSWNDTSCVVGPDGNSVMFPPPNTPFVTTNEQMQVGHLEVLGTWDLGDLAGETTDRHACWDGADDTYWGDPSISSCEDGHIDLSAAGVHGDDGKPADCDSLVEVLSDVDLVYQLRRGDTFGCDGSQTFCTYPDYIGDDLFGRYVITAGADGVEAGGDAVHLKYAEFDLFAQSQSDCEESNECYSYYAWDKAEWDHPHLAELGYHDGDLYYLQTMTTAEEVSGDWSNNPGNFVGVDWVFTFFSKYAYLDYVSGNDCDGSGSAKGWCLLSVTRTDEGQNNVWTEESTTNTCLVDNDIEVWGAEEEKATGNVNVSPGQRDTLDLCNEVNVFTFAADEGAAPRDSLIQTNERRLVLGFKNLSALRGWAEMDLAWPDDSYDDGGSLGGLIFTTRATNDPNHNNGSITGFVRTKAYED